MAAEVSSRAGVFNFRRHRHWRKSHLESHFPLRLTGQFSGPVEGPVLSSLKVALVAQRGALIQGLRPLISCRLWPLLDHTQRPPTLSAAAIPPCLV